VTVTDANSGKPTVADRCPYRRRKQQVPSSEKDLLEEVERLRRENEALRAKTKAADGLTFRVSEKGAVSVYGLGRFPVTLYQEQWDKLLARADDLRAFIEANQGQLKKKA
jgi:hypothetical protein